VGGGKKGGGKERRGDDGQTVPRNGWNFELFFSIIICPMSQLLKHTAKIYGMDTALSTSIGMSSNLIPKDL